MANLLGDVTPQIQVFSNGTTIEYSETVAANVREILRPGREVIGSIEGTLDRLDSHGPFKFAIHEPVLNYRIEGELARDAEPTLHDQIIHLYEVNVIVEGILRTNPHGEVRSIIARSIQARQRRPRFEQVSEIAGIYDITGGVEVAEYVRSMRYAD